ncbi:hypothetical protein F4808DRAFT_466669 [Astrocystis sublimbata]|nr:hypothetical protein F4808DRAFT_466669 [Astrocystis sublimbata]
MIPTPPNKRGPKPSKKLPKDIEDELRTDVFDAVDDHVSNTNPAPQLIIANPETGCHGTCSQHGEITQFIFNHGKLAHSRQCKCMSSSANGEATVLLPRMLDHHRFRLVEGEYDDVPALEPKLAAMVVMKLFLGMEVPGPLGLKLRLEPVAEGKGKGIAK